MKTVSYSAYGHLQIHFGVAYGKPSIGFLDVENTTTSDWLPQVSAECGFYVHLVNLFKMREVDLESPLGLEYDHVWYQNDTSWHWILGSLHSV